MLGGYWQKIAVIDLSTEKVDYLVPSEDDLKNLLAAVVLAPSFCMKTPSRASTRWGRRMF